MIPLVAPSGSVSRARRDGAQRALSAVFLSSFFFLSFPNSRFVLIFFSFLLSSFSTLYYCISYSGLPACLFALRARWERTRHCPTLEPCRSRRELVSSLKRLDNVVVNVPLTSSQLRQRSSRSSAFIRCLSPVFRPVSSSFQRACVCVCVSHCHRTWIWGISRGAPSARLSGLLMPV